MIQKQPGFTLLELLIVIAIIGILSSIVFLSINNARVRGRDAKRIGDMRQMVSSLEQYYIQNGFYPTGTASIASPGSLLSGSDALNGSQEPLTPGYIATIPVAPAPADGSCAGNSGRNGNSYWYDAAPDGSFYTITFCLGKDNENWGSGVRTATPDGIE
ncbi:MAG: prepilin-type N-terminal cleavage/methylation domain-containing protein [Patescibacteria group bacterium]|nr:prepilin-type N-terminal cleavage/methylation domain-containing protein [Patescibacteria group bacterium]